MLQVLAQYDVEMAWSGDQKVVEAFPSQGADEPFRDRVRPGPARRPSSSPDEPIPAHGRAREMVPACASTGVFLLTDVPRASRRWPALPSLARTSARRVVAPAHVSDRPSDCRRRQTDPGIAPGRPRTAGGRRLVARGAS